MSENKTIARQWFEEVWNQRSAAAVDQRMSPNCVVHGLGQTGEDLHGPAGFKPFQQAFLDAFPDLHIDVEDVIGEGDKVVVRWTASGRHSGAGLGLPPTNKTMRVGGMTIARITNGTLVEGWNNFDVMGMMQQLGALPPPPAKW